MTDVLHVRVNSPQEIVWEGDAVSVSSENTDGKFDILPFHTNFISIIEGKPVIVKTLTEEKKFTFDRTVIYATKNTVNIYTHI